jgi:hypothetical protein
MKMHFGVKIAGAFDVDALRILRALPGVDVVSTDDTPGVAVLTAAGTTQHLTIATSARLNAGAARQVVTDGAERRAPLLVVAGRTTADARALLREHGVGIVDGQGNAHIELPGVVIHVTGDDTRPAPRPPTRLTGKAGVVAQALLLDPERAWGVSALAEAARVSTGLVHRVLTRLEAETLVQSQGKGPARVRVVREPAGLLDLWAEEQQDAPMRLPAYRLGQTSAQVAREVLEGLADARIEHALTGAAAAATLAPFVTAIPVIEVWVEATASDAMLLNATDAEEVTSGHNLVFLQGNDDLPLRFATTTGTSRTVNPFRLYVDLRRDPRRGAEQAERLRDEVIGF